MVYCLLSRLPDTYDDAVQRSPATQQAVLSVLLDRCLPLLAAHSSPDTLADITHPHGSLAYCLGFALDVSCIRELLEQRLAQPRGTAIIQHAIHVATALPSQCSLDAATADTIGAPHMGAAILLGVLCVRSPRLPAGAPSAAAWPFVEAVPRIATWLAALTANSSVPVRRLASICFWLEPAAVILLDHLPAIANTRQLLAWAEAAEAAVRLAPPLLQLHDRCLGLEPRTWGGTVCRHSALLLPHLLPRLLEKAGTAAVFVEAPQTAPQVRAADKSLMQQLWALHTSTCRLLAWLAANPTAAQALAQPHADTNESTISILLEGFSSLRFGLLQEAQRCMEAGMLR